MEISLGSLKRGAEEAQGTTIIIDVFRAFTTAAIAFDRGAKEIVLFADPNDALDLHRKGVGDYLMGEVSGKKPDGFHFGNSPHEISDVDMTGKYLYSAGLDSGYLSAFSIGDKGKLKFIDRYEVGKEPMWVLVVPGE